MIWQHSKNSNTRRMRQRNLLPTIALAIPLVALNLHLTAIQADTLAPANQSTSSTSHMSIPTPLFGNTSKTTTPDWRGPINGSSSYFKQGLSPTLLGVFSYEGRNVGANYYFSVPPSGGRRLGEPEANSALLWTDQRTNGDLSLVNPGLDVIALDFVIEF